MKEMRIVVPFWILEMKKLQIVPFFDLDPDAARSL